MRVIKSWKVFGPRSFDPLLHLADFDKVRKGRL
jgi:hypothetical protein